MYVIVYGMHCVGKYVLAYSMTHATWAYAAESQLELSIVKYALFAVFPCEKIDWITSGEY